MAGLLEVVVVVVVCKQRALWEDNCLWLLTAVAVTNAHNISPVWPQHQIRENVFLYFLYVFFALCVYIMVCQAVFNNWVKMTTCRSLIILTLAVYPIVQ